MALHRDHPGISRPPDADDQAAQKAGTLDEQRAKEISSHLGATHPQRETHQWMPRRTETGWQVVKIALPPPEDNLIAETRADERPDIGDDPRSSINRNLGGYTG
jgi:hypothetical protein